MVYLSPRIVSLDQIASDRRWSLNQDLPAEPGDELINSIERFSILHPPILQSRQTGTDPSPSWEIVCGARRIAALNQLANHSQVPCLVIEPAADPEEVLPLVIEEQLRTGPLSPIQTARLAALAEPILGPDPDFTAFGQLKSLHSSRKRGELKRLLTLEPAIRRAIHSSACSAQTGLFLTGLDAGERQVLFAIITRLALNANKQRKLIEFCRIIATCRQCALSDIFATDFPELLSGTVDNIPQQSARLMKALHRSSHPLSSRAEEKFAQDVKNMELPGNCRISHSPSFEQDTVTLEMDFTRLEECRKFLESTAKRAAD